MFRIKKISSNKKKKLRLINVKIIEVIINKDLCLKSIQSFHALSFNHENLKIVKSPTLVIE